MEEDPPEAKLIKCFLYNVAAKQPNIPCLFNLNNVTQITKQLINGQSLLIIEFVNNKSITILGYFEEDHIIFYSPEDKSKIDVCDIRN